MGIRETLLKLLLKEPFYGHIASKLEIRKNIDIQKLKILVHPSLVLLYNPDWFNKQNEVDKYGAIFHELLHIILLHPYRRGTRRKDLWAISCDMAVNQYIDREFINNSSVTIEIIAFEFNLDIKYFQSCEYYYEIIKKIKPRLDINVSENGALMVLKDNRELQSDIIEDKLKNSAELGLLKNEIAKSIEYSGASIEELNSLYSDYMMDWRWILKKFLSKRGRQNRRKSFRRVSRRFESYPGTVYSKGVEALIALDESGSMSDDLIKIYIRELKEINQLTGVKIHVVRFDSECSEPVLLKKYIEDQGRERRGGTDFTKIFNLADKMKIELVVIFTDGKGLVPKSVNQKVFWLLTGGGINPSNFGEILYFTM